MPLLRAQGADARSSTRRRSRTRCATRGSPPSWTRRGPRARRCRTCPAFATRRGGQRSKRALRGKPPTFANVRHGRRRHRADRVHVGHDGQAEGHDALPSRRDGVVRLLAAADAARRARRRVHRQPAARVHVRARRAAAVPAAHRRGTLLLEKTVARRAAAGDRSATGATRAVHRADVVPRDGAAGRASTTCRACASACRPARRCRRRRASCGRTRPASRSSTASASTEMLHIFISHDEAHARPGATGKPVPGYGACVMDDDGHAAAAGQGRAARGEGADRLPLPRRRAPGELRAGRLELHRRRVPGRRRRLVRLPGAHRRHDHLGRLQHRRPRGRERAAAAPGGGRVRRGRRRPTRSAGRSSRRSSC